MRLRLPIEILHYPWLQQLTNASEHSIANSKNKILFKARKLNVLSHVSTPDNRWVYFGSTSEVTIDRHDSCHNVMFEKLQCLETYFRTIYDTLSINV